MHWLAELAPKSANYQYTKLRQLSEDAIMKGAKITLSLPSNLTQSRVLIRNERVFLSRQNLRKFIKLDSNSILW